MSEQTDVEAHGLPDNVNETVVEDEPDVEGHGHPINVNEAVIEDAEQDDA